MAKTKTKLVLGRGKLYFETADGSGERYIGNTPAFQIDREIETLTRSTSYGGRKIEIPGATISEKNEVSFTTDHIVLENVGLWYGVQAEEAIVLGVNQVTETFTANPGRFYQLGLVAYGFAGIRHAENVTVRYNGGVVPMIGNYTLYAAAGRLELLPGGLIPKGAVFEVDFEWRGSRQDIIKSEPKAVLGSLRFMAANVVGDNRNYYFPSVRLTPKGVLDLKGDSFQQMSFNVEVFAKAPGVHQIYVDSVTTVLYTEDEQAIVDDLSLIHI